MSPHNSQSGKNGQIGLVVLLLVIILILIFAGGRHFFRDTRRDLKTTVQDAGQDLKEAGRHAADSIRDTVQ